MSNIFQLYLENNQLVPFVVYRSNWGPNFGLVVTKVELNKYPKNKGGPYGKAWGYGLPPLDGQPKKDYWGLPGNPKEISCAGCWQWESVTEIPDAWRLFLDS